jgi:hypothetical protein
MSRSAGDQLPASIRASLDGGRLEERVGLTILALTADEASWPSAALLSVGEMVAPTPSTVRLALWPGTQTTRNLTRSSRGTLAFFGEGVATYVRIAARRGPNLRAGGMDHAYFEATVEEVLRDEVTYARMTSGITFELPDPGAILPRWRATVDALLGAPAVGEGGPSER